MHTHCFDPKIHRVSLRKILTCICYVKTTEQPDYKQQTDKAVEGAGVFQLIGSDTYVLMYDVYMNGAYEFTESEDLVNFRLTKNKVTMNFHPRHGTVIQLRKSEMQRLEAKWPNLRAYQINKMKKNGKYLATNEI